MDSGEKWYSRKEVAARWSVSEDTVRRMVMDGDLVAIVIRTNSGKRKRQFITSRISETECQRFERSHQTRGRGAAR